MGVQKNTGATVQIVSKAVYAFRLVQRHTRSEGKSKQPNDTPDEQDHWHSLKF
jgi:hypothetical protein